MQKFNKIPFSTQKAVPITGKQKARTNLEMVLAFFIVGGI